MRKGTHRDYSRHKKAKSDDDIIVINQVDSPSIIGLNSSDDGEGDDTDEIIVGHFRHRKLNSKIVQVTHRENDNKLHCVYRKKNVISHDVSSSQTRDLSLNVSEPPEVEDLTSCSPRKSSQQQASTSQSTSIEFLASDVDLASRTTLKLGRMLNDTIVHFYMHYLMERAKPQVKQSIILFNSFFYSKFKKLYKEMIPKRPKSVRDIKPEFHETVQRWGKQIKVFDRNFLVFPVCDCEHWLLIVVAYASQVVPRDVTPSRSESVREHLYRHKKNVEPALLIFDSLRFRYLPGFTEPVRSLFLRLRWTQERPNEEPRDFDEFFMREIAAKVTRQGNSYDCGIHMLHTFEKFLENPQEIYMRVKTGADLTSELRVDTKTKRAMIGSLLTSANEKPDQNSSKANDASRHLI